MSRLVPCATTRASLLNDAGLHPRGDHRPTTAVPEAGGLFEAVADGVWPPELAERRIAGAKEKQFSLASRGPLDNLFSQMAQNDMGWPFVVKADVQGSAEAVSRAWKISNDEVKRPRHPTPVSVPSASPTLTWPMPQRHHHRLQCRPDNVARKGSQLPPRSRCGCTASSTMHPAMSPML